MHISTVQHPWRKLVVSSPFLPSARAALPPKQALYGAQQACKTLTRLTSCPAELFCFDMSRSEQEPGGQHSEDRKRTHLTLDEPGAPSL